jgi:hypothetical protein
MMNFDGKQPNKTVRILFDAPEAECQRKNLEVL